MPADTLPTADVRAMLEALDRAEIPFRAWAVGADLDVRTWNGVSIGEAWSRPVADAFAAAPTLARELIAAREERDAYRALAARIAVMVAPADAADLAVSHLTVNDLDNLGDTVERRLAEPPGHIAVCPECRCENARCDEERCCLNCGTDIIVCADKYSAELLCALEAGEDVVAERDRLARLLAHCREAAVSRVPAIAEDQTTVEAVHALALAFDAATDERDRVLRDFTGLDAAGWEEEGRAHVEWMRAENRGGGVVTCPDCGKGWMVDGTADVDLSPRRCEACEHKAVVAERDRLRQELADLRALTADVMRSLRWTTQRDEISDPIYEAKVESVCDGAGYGALMDSAQRCWRKALKRRGEYVGGELVAGPCRGTVDAWLRKWEVIENAADRAAKGVGDGG